MSRSNVRYEPEARGTRWELTNEGREALDALRRHQWLPESLYPKNAPAIEAQRLDAT